MPTYSRVEVAVGFFVVLGAAAVAYLSLSLGEVRWFGVERMSLTARFASVGELRPGAPVKLAGVKIGEVQSIELDAYAAQVRLGVDPSLALPTDTIASIRTAGLLGESYVSLSPGASEDDLKSGDRIFQTESPVDLMELVSKYAFGDASGAGSPPAEGAGDDPGDPFGL